MKKEFDMSDLLNNLTSEPEVETGRRTRTGSKEKKQMEHECTLIETSQMAKVRAIADREGIALKDIFAVGLNMAIASYESKNGEVRVKKAKRGNASEVFGVEDEA